MVVYFNLVTTTKKVVPRSVWTSKARRIPTCDATLQSTPQGARVTRGATLVRAMTHTYQASHLLLTVEPAAAPFEAVYAAAQHVFVVRPAKAQRGSAASVVRPWQRPMATVAGGPLRTE